MNLAQYIGRMGWMSRTQATKTIKNHSLILNGHPITNPLTHLTSGDIIDRPLISIFQHVVRLSVTLLVHKPAGYVCSDRREGQRLSRRDLVNDAPMKNDLRCAGRLDVDTTGLLVCSTDGNLIHRIISPKTQCPKTYTVFLAKPITDEECRRLEQGVMLDDGITSPAHVTKINQTTIDLTITEGRYHQIKRMCLAIGNSCVGLHRWRVGDWTLDTIPEGKRYSIPDT